MNSQKIGVEIREWIATVTFRNPDKLNAWDGQMLEELKAHVDEIATRDDVRVVVFTGEGRAFSVGADLNWFTPDPQTHRFRVQALYAHNLFDAIEELEKPVVAAINGLCVGGGLEFALSCDLRVAVEDARFGFPEVNAGIIPGSGGCSRLARLVGVGNAKELVLTGELIPASEAKDIGLINAVVSADQLIAKINDIAGKILKRGPLAVGLAKQIINAALNVDAATGRTLERLGQSILLKTEDAEEGFKAFREKRPARFSGR
jgi:enoyl-CoA hydratase/carnithine racemase